MTLYCVCTVLALVSAVSVCVEHKAAQCLHCFPAVRCKHCYTRPLVTGCMLEWCSEQVGFVPTCVHLVPSESYCPLGGRLITSVTDESQMHAEHMQSACQHVGNLRLVRYALARHVSCSGCHQLVGSFLQAEQHLCHGLV